MKDIQSLPELNLVYLPEFARHILEEKIDDYVKLIIHHSRTFKIPLLKYFDSFSETELLNLTLEGSVVFLSAIRDRNLISFILQSKNDWLKNNLKIVTREQVVVEDILLVNHARRETLVSLIPSYTNDFIKGIEICREIDRFILVQTNGLFKTFVNIQEEQILKANEDLAKRENQLLEAQSIARIGSFEWDLSGDGKSTFTPEVFKIFEMEKTDGLENFLLDVHPEDRQKLRKAIANSYNSGIYECEYRFIRNNKLKYIHSRGIVYYIDGKASKIIGTLADVTERASLIARLLESEELNRQSQELTNTGSWKWHISDNRIEWSDEMYRIYGLTKQSEEITFDRFLSFIHADYRDKRIAEIHQSLHTGESGDYIMKIVAADGNEKILKGKSRVLKNSEGSLVGMLGTCQDITNEYSLSEKLSVKNYELQKKNQEIENYNFIASHDLQEPLRKIQVFGSRISKADLSLLPRELSRNVVGMRRSADVLQKMINDFLTFHQYFNRHAVVEEVELTKLAEEIICELDSLIKQFNVQITLYSLPIVMAKKSHIRQALASVIQNAIKFRTHDRQCRITIHSEAVDRKNKPYYKISIRDNGIGFEQKYADRIFDLFQKLHSKEDFEGNGVGLALCKKVVEDHKGFVAAEGEIGKGSVFSIYLPINYNPSTSLHNG